MHKRFVTSSLSHVYVYYLPLHNSYNFHPIIFILDQSKKCYLLRYIQLVGYSIRKYMNNNRIIYVFITIH